MKNQPHERTIFRKVFKKALNISGILVCILLTFIIIVNGTMIVKSYIYPDKVPDFLGYKPFIVLSGSMEPTILTGDLVLTREIAAETITKDDIITFSTDKNTVVTHRVTEVVNQDGALSFLTKGDANIGSDASVVKPENLEGKYLGRVGGLGRFAMFLQTPIGMLIFVVTPLCLFIVYDLLGRKRRSKQKGNREAELEAELAALKAAQKENSEPEAKGENFPS
ncbi:MAG: signal peptidase I [Desulfitobacteriaceae bacterium]|nr:signal peptidase I [Desulfitobacteriaceae bacterium]MDD4345681.1 signal peptidase I [Desulfitobacteriaceae bacterium]MDD4400505.1 signal peptidase I [Desulfitobacteriaceae bacterium]